MPLTNARVDGDEDAPEDVSILHMPEGPVVVLRSGKWQSQENAIRHLQVAAGPGAHPDDVRALVRKHLPDALDFDVLSQSTAPPTYIRSEAATAKKKPLWVTRALMVGTGFVIAVTALIGYHVASTSSTTDGPVNMMGTDFFKGFTMASGYRCTPLDYDDADCLALDTGRMTVVSARAGDFHKPDTYWFRNSDRISVVFEFESPDLAASYANTNSNRRLWPYITAYGNHVVTSIDAAAHDRLLRGVKSYESAEAANQLPG